MLFSNAFDVIKQSNFICLFILKTHFIFVLVTPMKWLGSGEGDAIVKAEMDRGPQRTQDDAAVGYVFQRPPDPEFPSFGQKQLRWALGDDSIIDVSVFFFSVLLLVKLIR